MSSIQKLLHSSWAAPILIGACIFLLPFGRSVELPMAIMAIAGFVRLMLRPSEVLHDPAVRLLAGLFACIWLPMVFALFDAVSLNRSLSTTLVFLRFLFMGIYMLHALRVPDTVQRVMLILLVVLCFWTLDALAQSFFGWDLLGKPNEGDRLRGIFYPSYKLGNVMAVLTPVFFGLLHQQSRRWTWIWLLAIPYLSVILLTGSRTSWLMLTLGLFIYGFTWIWSLTSTKRIKHLSLALMLAVITVTLVSHNPNFKKRFDETRGLFKDSYQAVNVATSDRLPIWEIGVKIFQDHPINGVGPRGFRNIYPAYAPPGDIWMILNPHQGPTHPHQITLEIGVESGAIGLIGFVLLWLWLILRWWQLRCNATNSQLPWLIAASVGLFPLNAGHAFYDSFWSSIVFWLLIFVVAHHRSYATEAPINNKI